MSDQYKTVRELLSDPDRWTKKAMAVDGAGCPVVLYSPEACRWCLLGAMLHVYRSDEEYGKASERLYSMLRPQLQEFSLSEAFNLVAWNDAEERTYQEVIDLVTKAGV